MSGAEGGRGEGLQGEIPRGDGVQGVGHGRIKAQGRGGHVAVDGEGGAGQGGGPQGALVHPRPGVGEAGGVAAEHLHIGHQVVAEGHRLGRLKVREARDQGVGVGGGLPHQGALQRLDLADGAVAGLADPEAEIERDLVIARTRRVQAPGRWADQLAQPGLDVQVNVLEFLPEGELSGLDLGLDVVQALLDLRLVGGGDDPGGGQHGGMGARSGQILPRHAPVEPDGDLNGLHQVCGLAREPSPP